ncbi:uncharacterized protein [Typha angustifolia]|uniref:uncharacterized protein n=1 Tax=Typha angustifolia TaxID=59011 RepID=UPI003C2CB586
MEESRRAKIGRVSFQRQTPLTYPMSQRLENIDDLKALEMCKQDLQLSNCYCPLEIPKSPQKAMEFLSRTWSPSSSDFFQLFSSNSLMSCFDNGGQEENTEMLDDQEKEHNMVHLNPHRVDQISTVLSNGNAPQKYKTVHTSWMNAGHMKAWWRGEVLSSFSKSHRRKRKEEIRLHMSQVHAALSVARLAAAIAGIVANSHMEPKSMPMASEGGDWDKKMNTVVASAAALVATVCAEAAESVGANRSIVASAINMGLEARTSPDMLTLTATAATCLRGAAALELRAATSSYVSEEHKILERGTRLLVRAPAGRIQLRIVSIYFKRDKLTLRLGKKHMRGAFTSFKDYAIFDELEDTTAGVFCKDQHSLHAITLGTTGGTIQILFEDQKQFRIWKSTLFHLLPDQPFKHIL